jgi:hypothetical protein
MTEYKAWHTEQLAAGPSACSQKLSLVWKPEAGIGDAAFSLCQAFMLAIQTGRLFFIDWNMPIGGTDSHGEKTAMSWKAVLEEPFSWDYTEAKSAGLICPEESPDDAENPIIFMIDMDAVGGKSDALYAEQAARPRYGLGTDSAEAAMLRFLLHPSLAVQDHIEDLQLILKDNFVVSMAIRTGVIEDSNIRFLSKSIGTCIS